MKRNLIALSLLISGSCFCPAQSVNGPGDDVLCSGYAPVPLMPAARLRGATNIRLSQPSPLYAVTGKPFSGRRVVQELKILADGTRLCEPPHLSIYYRDSAGRTRLEDSFGVQGPDGKPAPLTVKILDPVAQIEYLLDMVNQIAYRLVPTKAADIKPVPPGLPIAPPVAISEKTENLGKHLFEGIEVEGRRITATATPPGYAGPISTSNEIWISPDRYPDQVLQKQVTPSNSRTDVYLGISTADPDPALFIVPAGWKVVDRVTSAPSAGGGARRTTAGYEYTARIAPPDRSDFVVTGAPYSAERIQTWTGNLAGAAESRTNEPVKLYRDSYGRTRIERPLIHAEFGYPRSAPVLPEINDPVARVQIILDPFHKIAHRFALPAPETHPPPREASASPHPGSVESVRDLGKGTIAEVSVEGTLRTYRTPAGVQGNDRELTETTESWYSPDLRIIMRAKFDTVTQKSTSELTSVNRAEPDPALFKIPPGYTVVDDKAIVTIIVTQP
jgi:hypothetical protein